MAYEGDGMDKIDGIIQMLEDITNDRTVPKNVRSEIENAIKTLKSDKFERIVKINTAISILDEVSTDSNIPMYARTQIWNILSLMEQIAKNK